MNELIYAFSKNPTIDLIKKICDEIHPNELLPDYFNITLMHFRQSKDTMKYLLKRGGNPNIRSSLGICPIHMQKEYSTIKLLIDYGAIPNPRDIYDFSPLYWQKDLDSVKLLLKYNPLMNNFIYQPKTWSHRHYYNQMFIEGGYDPYSENNISITPIFLQKDPDVLDYLLENAYFNDIPSLDLAYETILFKPSINHKIINICKKNHVDFNHKNIIGNTALHVQHDPKIIAKLLIKDANYTLKNNDGLTPYEYHRKRNNISVYLMIEKYSAARYIQDFWKRFWFKKTYIPPKYYKIKKKFLYEFTMLPPSKCGIFPGGIEYQNAQKNFNSKCVYIHKL